MKLHSPYLHPPPDGALYLLSLSPMLVPLLPMCSGCAVRTQLRCKLHFMMSSDAAAGGVLKSCPYVFMFVFKILMFDF